MDDETRKELEIKGLQQKVGQLVIEAYIIKGTNHRPQLRRLICQFSAL